MTPKCRLVVASLVLLSLLALPAGTASAQECTLDPAGLQSLADSYNQHVDQVPAFAIGQFAGERIDVRLDSPDGERRFAVTTAEDGRITALSETAADDPTLRVEATESTFCTVVESDDHTAAFVEAYDSGAIDVSGVGTVNAVKVGAVKVGVSVTRVLSGLF